MGDERDPASPMAVDEIERVTSTGSLPSPSIEVESHDDLSGRLSLDHRMSEPRSVHSASPGYKSPARQHRRTPSVHREVKETLDAKTEYANDEKDGRMHHRINQYVILEEIGRGSYGAVHLATDQKGTEYAVKEFSKVRLRKRAQSNILRHGPRRVARMGGRGGLQAPLSPHLADFDPSGGAEEKDALFLIREEIAIMKKLNHPNLVQLIEVLDDPEEDSLYMVLEMCKKGVIMKVGLDNQATPYSEDSSKIWFRDLILGIEYLHAQGVIHRDIKPDNLLRSDDDVLKIVDFGVSEMFSKPDEMMTAKSAGSPAFLPPELCVARHGDVSGKAADIWSMGVTLYCLRYGRIPFERPSVLDMYEAIKTEQHKLPPDENPDFVDLMNRILEKDPRKRITMAELREHPWVTNHGHDPLVSAEENCAHMIDPPNDLELNRAFTRKMNHLLCVMKVMYKLKLLHARKLAERGQKKPSPSPTTSPTSPPFSPSEEKAKAEEIEALIAQRRSFRQSQDDSNAGRPSTSSDETTSSETLFLGIGTGARDDFAMDEATPDVVSDSPINVDFNIYDRAYEEEISRIMSNPARRSSSMYLNRLVKEKEQYKQVANMVDGAAPGTPIRGGFASILGRSLDGSKA